MISEDMSYLSVKNTKSKILKRPPNVGIVFSVCILFYSVTRASSPPNMSKFFIINEMRFAPFLNDE